MLEFVGTLHTHLNRRVRFLRDHGRFRGVEEAIKRMEGIICFFIFACSFSFSYDFKLTASVRLSQEDEILYMSSGLGVTEDGFFIIADRRGSNIKVYGNDGRLKHIWGRRGVGPNEFLGPCFLYYDSSYLVFFDIGQMRSFIYQTTKNFDFKKVREIICASGPFDFSLVNNQAWIPEYIIDRVQTKYALYSVDIKSGNIQYILPDSEFQSLFSHKEWPVIGGKYYCLPADDVVYCVWEGNIRIMRWDLKTRQPQFFGKTTENYIKPYVTRAFRESYSGPKHNFEAYMSNKRKMCYVSGLFGDGKFVGLVYHRYDFKNNHWMTFIHMYSPTGEFISEILLSQAITYDDMLERCFYYSREKRLFYFLSRTLDDKYQDQFTILTYSLSTGTK